MRTDPGDDAAPRDRQRFWLAVTIAFIVLGASLRLSQYGSRQSFWGDEAALLFNITQKSTAELMSGPLDHGQAAPPLFLATQRWIALTLGTGEYAQRLVPLLLGVAVPALGAWLAWQWTTPSGAAFVAAVLALSDAFIWQSATLKPYSGDVFFALVLLLIYPPPLPDDVARPRTRPVSQSRGRRFWIASIVAAVAVWYSLGVVFVYAGLASVALVDSYLHQRRHFQARFTAVALLFQGSFVALYMFSLRHQTGDTYLQNFWAFAFPDWSQPSTLPRWFGAGAWDLAGYVGWPLRWLPGILSPLAIIGFISLKRQGKLLFALALLAPVAMTLLAALLHHYPWTGRRVTMFLVPGIVMLAGAGVAGLFAMPQRAPRWIAAIGLVPIVALLVIAVPAIAMPRTRTHLRPVIEYVREHRAPGEPIFVSAPRLEFEWYWPDAAQPLSFAPPQGELAPGSRIWYVVVPTNPERPRYVQRDPSELRRSAREIDRFIVQGGAAYRFEAPAAAAEVPAVSVEQNP
jgi:hypothetical protein